MLVVELVRSASLTFGRVLFVSAHGGNSEPLGNAVRRLRSEGHDVRACSPATCWRGDAHAGRVETSVMLVLRPAFVNLAVATKGNARPLAEILPQTRARGVAALSPNGVLVTPQVPTVKRASTYSSRRWTSLRPQSRLGQTTTPCGYDSRRASNWHGVRNRPRQSQRWARTGPAQCARQSRTAPVPGPGVSSHAPGQRCAPGLDCPH
jgi:hypothetical protein